MHNNTMRPKKIRQHISGGFYQIFRGGGAVVKMSTPYPSIKITKTVKLLSRF